MGEHIGVLGIGSLGASLATILLQSVVRPHLTTGIFVLRPPLCRAPEHGWPCLGLCFLAALVYDVCKLLSLPVRGFVARARALATAIFGGAGMMFF